LIARESGRGEPKTGMTREHRILEGEKFISINESTKGNGDLAKAKLTISQKREGKLKRGRKKDQRRENSARLYVKPEGRVPKRTMLLYLGGKSAIEGEGRKLITTNWERPRRCPITREWCTTGLLDNRTIEKFFLMEEGGTLKRGERST